MIRPRTIYLMQRIFQFKLDYFMEQSQSGEGKFPTQARIAREFGITQGRVSQLEKMWRETALEIFSDEFRMEHCFDNLMITKAMMRASHFKYLPRSERRIFRDLEQREEQYLAYFAERCGVAAILRRDEYSGKLVRIRFGRRKAAS